MLTNHMDSKEFKKIRKRLNRTQKEIAPLLGVSQKAIHSYEQGLRNIPPHVERQMLFLLSRNVFKLCWALLYRSYRGVKWSYVCWSYLTIFIPRKSCDIEITSKKLKLSKLFVSFKYLFSQDIEIHFWNISKILLI
jgi:DNA-binding XRE family transcriptional regulator